jgi:hypothetical protein
MFPFHRVRCCAAVLGVIVASGLAATDAQAQSAAPAKSTELILCNKTGGGIQVAVAYMDATTGKWTMSAWHNRQPGECKSFGGIRTGLFYYHAKNERGGVWPGKDSVERSYCVPSTAVKRDMNSSQCGAGDTQRGFRGRVVDPGKYTFSFS